VLNVQVSFPKARFEIIGALANACFLVAMSFLMVVEAIQRLLERSGAFSLLQMIPQRAYEPRACCDTVVARRYTLR
jgi:divalent metal cation (Fe/Co/Zn/Cd) transporter